MTYFLLFLIGSFAIAAAIALVRGLLAFMRDAEQLRLDPQGKAAQFGLKQNRMMSQRVLFQGIAILLIALVGALVSHD